MPSLLNTVRDLERLRHIVLVLARHGFGEVVQRTGLASLLPKREGSERPSRVQLGERVRLVIEELGPSFIKLGQIFSTRPDVIPDSVIVELKKLQDQVPPVPFEALKSELEEQLGGSIDQVYSWFDTTPLASASIAQVHRATLRTSDGERDVVVKMQRPNIRSVIERDVDLLYWLAHAVERSIPESNVYSPVKLVAEFDRAIGAELDFTLEADHAERFAENFANYPGIHFPKVYRQASSRKVLTLEYLDGMSIERAVASGMSGERIAKQAVGIVVKQIFEDGFFHADPHPGNVIMLGTPDEPVIGMIDLGLVGRLTPRLRDKTVDLMVAAVREDHRAIADALYALGKTSKKIDREAFEGEVAVLADKYLGKSLKDIQFSFLVRDLVTCAVKYGLEIPPDFLMVGKTLMTVEGVGKAIYPELDVFHEVRPYFMKLMWQRYSPEKLSQDMLRSVTRLGGAASELPTQLQEVLDDLRRANLTLQIREPGLTSAADRLGRRVFSGTIIGALILAGALLVSTGHDIAGGSVAAVSSLWLFGHWTVQFARGRSARR